MRQGTILASIGLIAVVCLAGMTGGLGQEPPTYQSVQQQGDVKVTLLNVARIMSFDPPDASGRARLIPGVAITFAVEDTGAMPLGLFHFGAVKCFVAGEPAVTMTGVVAGGHSITRPWSAVDAETGLDHPEVASAERTRLRREYLRGVVLEGERVDIHIETGFGGLQTFKFENVPLAVGGR
jgi:hypothetical protein